MPQCNALLLLGSESTMVHHRLEDGIHEKHSLYPGDLVIRRASAARDWALHVPARVVGTGQSIDKIADAGASRQKVGVVGVRSTDGEAESAASARRLAAGDSMADARVLFLFLSQGEWPGDPGWYGNCFRVRGCLCAHPEPVCASEHRA